MKNDSTLRKVWNFIWHDDSLLSWIVNIVLAFILVKFIIYPGLGLIFGTGYPVVAVVSGSMEHQRLDFNSWWEANHKLYDELNITKENFANYKFKNGFNKGDLMVIFGSNKFEQGDVIVFTGGESQPIIHRIVKIKYNIDIFYIQTKGDNNSGSRNDEININKDRILGKAVLRIPYLGWFKLGFLKVFGIV